jgi:hypothetical protein
MGKMEYEAPGQDGDATSGIVRDMAFRKLIYSAHLLKPAPTGGVVKRIKKSRVVSRDEVIQRLLEEHDRNPIWQMELDDAVPLIMEEIGVGEDEAIDVWLRHRGVMPTPPVPIVPLFLGVKPGEDVYIHMFWNATDMIVVFDPGNSLGMVEDEA